MLDSTRRAQVSRGMPNFCQRHQGLSYLNHRSWLFWVNHFGTRKKHSPRWPISNGASKHRYRDTKTRPYSRRDVNKNPLPVGIELESGALSIKYELTNLTTKSWGKKEYCVIRSNAHDFMSIWGFRAFFWSILLISSNFHILSRMMIILSSLFFACQWLPCKGVITNLNDALFRKLAQQSYSPGKLTVHPSPLKNDAWKINYILSFWTGQLCLRASC